VRDWLVLAVATLWMLGCAEGRVALPGGGEGRAAVGERVAHAAERVVQGPGIDTLEELQHWTCAHRYVPPLTDAQRTIYHIDNEPLCAGRM
jgi:hypothetical protein